MTCPKCNGPTEVQDSRKRRDGVVRRRRVCRNCGPVGSTLEVWAASSPAVGTLLTIAPVGECQRDDCRRNVQLLDRVLSVMEARVA